MSTSSAGSLSPQCHRENRHCQELHRLASFAKLGDLPVSAIRLAQSGFYYDSDQDDIICFSCGVRKRCWIKEENKIAMHHLIISPHCLHANFKDARNAPFTYYPFISSVNSPRVSLPEPKENGNKNVCDLTSMLQALRASTAHEIHEEPSMNMQETGSDSEFMTVSVVEADNRGTRTNNDRDSAEPSHENLVPDTTTQDDSLAEVSGCHFDEQDVDSVHTDISQKAVQTPRSTQVSGNDISELDEDDLHSDNTKEVASPSHAALSVRVSSFAGWMRADAPDTLSLARAGFYYSGYSDSVQCFCCNFTCANLRVDDDPWKIHDSFQISCDYAMSVKETHFSPHISVAPATDCLNASMTCLNNAYEQNVTPRRKKDGDTRPEPKAKKDRSCFVDKSTQTAANYFKSKTFVLAGNRDEEEQNETPPKSHKSEPGTAIFEEESNNDMGYIEKAPSTKLSLRTHICRLCGVKPMDTIFLPCGHFYTCQQCTSVVECCLVCSNRIKATLRVYLD